MKSFEHKGQTLYLAEVPNGRCSHGEIQCAMIDKERGCTATSVPSTPRCSGVIFVTKEQYLELRLLGPK